MKPDTDFELDFETISENRKSVKETITAAHLVKGDMVYPDNCQGFGKIDIPKQTDGGWDFFD